MWIAEAIVRGAVPATPVPVTLTATTAKRAGRTMADTLTNLGRLGFVGPKLVQTVSTQPSAGGRTVSAVSAAAARGHARLETRTAPVRLVRFARRGWVSFSTWTRRACASIRSVLRMIQPNVARGLRSAARSVSARLIARGQPRPIRATVVMACVHTFALTDNRAARSICTALSVRPASRKPADPESAAPVAARFRYWCRRCAGARTRPAVLSAQPAPPSAAVGNADSIPPVALAAGRVVRGSTARATGSAPQPAAAGSRSRFPTGREEWFRFTTCRKALRALLAQCPASLASRIRVLRSTTFQSTYPLAAPG